MSSIFISYRRADSPDTVARIFEKLVARLRNRDVFYDHSSLELGAEFPDVLRRQVTTAGVVLVIIGPRWVEELKKRKSAPVDFVREEISLALASGADVIPVLVAHASMPNEAELANFSELLPLIYKNAKAVPPDPLFEAECDKLIDHLERTGPSEIVGSVLAGKYKVQRQIGEGGMGDVYVAEQVHPVKRLIAVKLIKQGMDTKEVLARFDAERQALAVMDHPNVCKVLDAGTAPNGRPFFVMEYVKGVPITKFCDERKLTPRERLDLFMTVCKGVQHAHQKGIIHRDIKPGNVLVEMIDGKPVPKVIDFGLAKAMGLKLTDKSFAVTEFGKWVGTLEYSSPEQAEGRFDIDTLSDVYSLGVLLYELLAGSPPFSRATLMKSSEEEMRRVIKEDLPALPSKRLSSSQNLNAIAANRQLDPGLLTKTVRGDLDWIIMKALDKAPERRYATATAMAEDVYRHLNNEPILAGQPSTFYRLRKFVRRNRGAVLTACAIFTVLVGGLVAVNREQRKTKWALAQKKQALDEAEIERKNAIDSAALSIKRLDEKRNALDQMLGSFSDERLKMMPGAQEMRKVFLTKGIAQYEQLLQDRQSDAVVQERIADAYRELGLLQAELGSSADALVALEKSVELRRQLVNSSPGDTKAREELARILFQLGQFHFEQQRSTDAISPVRESIELYTNLWKQESDNPIFQAGLGRGLTRLESIDPSVEGETTLNRARELLTSASSRLPENAEIQTDLARLLNNLSFKSSDTLGMLREAQKAAERSLALNPVSTHAHSIRTRAIKNQAQILTETKRVTEAEKQLESAVEDSKAFVKMNPAIVQGYLVLTELEEKLAELYLQMRKPDQAIELREDCVRIYDSLMQRYSGERRYVISRNYNLFLISAIERNRRCIDQARVALDRILAVSAETMKLHADSAQLLGNFVIANFNRGDIEDELGQTQEALRFYQNAIDVFNKHPTLRADSIDPEFFVMKCVSQAIDCSRKKEDFPSAVRFAQEGIRIAHAGTKPEVRRQEISLLGTLAECVEACEGEEKGIAAWRRAAQDAEDEVRRKPCDFEAREVQVRSLQNLARLYRKNGSLDAELQVSRKYLSQLSYFDGKDYSQLQAKASDPNEASALLLRPIVDAPRRMLRLNVSIVLEGAPRSTPFYLTENLQTMDDQIEFLNERVEGKFNADQLKEYRNFGRIAFENNISFLDLVEYTVGQASRTQELLLSRAAQVRNLINSPLSAGEVKRKLVSINLLRARDYTESKLYQKAKFVLTESVGLLGGANFRGDMSAEDQQLLWKVLLARAEVEEKAGMFADAYFGLAKLAQWKHATDTKVALDGTVEMSLGRVCKQLGRRWEAASWFWRAVNYGNPSGISQLGYLFLEDPMLGKTVSPDFEALMAETLQGIPEAERFEQFPQAIYVAWEKQRFEKLRQEVEADPKRGAQWIRHVLSTNDGISILKAAADMRPEDPKLWSELGKLYRSAKRLDESKAAFRRSVSLKRTGQDGTRSVLLYLETLLLADDFETFADVVKKLDKSGWEASMTAPQSRPLQRVYWTLRALAAVVSEEDHDSALSQATVPEVSGETPAEWDWRDIGNWHPHGGKMSLTKLKNLRTVLTAALTPYIEELDDTALQTVLKHANASYFADLTCAIVLMNTGRDMYGRDFWAAMAMKPSMAQSFTKARQSGGMNLGDFGIILDAAEGSKPSPERQLWLNQEYGMHEDYESRLLALVRWQQAGQPEERKPEFLKQDAQAKKNPGDLSDAIRGHDAFKEKRYDQAIPPLERACKHFKQLHQIHEDLLQCYLEVNRPLDAAAVVASYKSEFDGDLSNACLRGCADLLVNNKFETLLSFTSSLEQQKWTPISKGEDREKFEFLFNAYRTLASLADGRDARAFEEKMHQMLKSGYCLIGWKWDPIEAWMKTAELSPQRRMQIERLISEWRAPDSLVDAPWEKLMETDPAILPKLLAYRMSRSPNVRNNIEELARSATKLQELCTGDPNKLYDAACGYALCAGLVPLDQAPTSENLQLKKRYQDLAIACLKQAIGAGYANYKHMATDSDFNSLRELPEYNSLFTSSNDEAHRVNHQ